MFICYGFRHRSSSIFIDLHLHRSGGSWFCRAEWCIPSKWSSANKCLVLELRCGVFDGFNLAMLKGSSGSRVDFCCENSWDFQFHWTRTGGICLLAFELRFFSGQMLQSEMHFGWHFSYIFRWSNTFINKNLGSPSNFLTQMSRPQRADSGAGYAGKSLEEPSNVWYFFSVTLKDRVLNHYWYYYESLLILLSKSKFRYVISVIFESRCAFEQAFWTIGYIGLAWISGRFGSVWVGLGYAKAVHYWQWQEGCLVAQHSAPPTCSHRVIWRVRVVRLAFRDDHCWLKLLRRDIKQCFSSNFKITWRRLPYAFVGNKNFKPKESELKSEPQNAYLQKEYLHAASFKGDITFLGQRM